MTETDQNQEEDEMRVERGTEIRVVIYTDQDPRDLWMIFHEDPDLKEDLLLDVMDMKSLVIILSLLPQQKHRKQLPKCSLGMKIVIVLL